MTVFGRLGFNYSNTIFNGADTLTPGAANTLNLLANNTPKFADWQKEDLASGPIVRTNYFQNPVAAYILTLQLTANAIINVANSIDPNVTANIANTNLVNAANSLIITLSTFKQHTDNMSGVVTVTNPSVPSYDTASGVGQINMLNISKTDGIANVPNTVPILGAFTSLYIGPTLNANTIQIQTFANTLNASLSGNVSNIAANTVNDAANIIYTLMNLVNSHQANDWAFYSNSVQIMKDSSFMLQFNTLGNTNLTMIMSLIGTPRLVANLVSTSS